MNVKRIAALALALGLALAAQAEIQQLDLRVEGMT